MHTARIIALSLILATAVVSAQSPPIQLNLSLESQRLSFDELARLFPALRGLELPPSIHITRLQAQGPLDRLQVNFSAESEAGSASGRMVLDVREPQRTARGTIRLDRFALATLLERPALPQRLTATATFDLRVSTEPQLAMNGTFEVTSPAATLAGYSAQAIHATGRIDDNRVTLDAAGGLYGANVHAAGTLTLGADYRFDLRGSAAALSLASLPSALPVPRVDSNLSFTYEVAGSSDGVHGRFVLDPSQIAGARLARGTTVRFDTRGRAEYLASGTVTGLDPRRVGAMFDLELLQSDRFGGSVNARFDLRASRDGLQSLQLDLFDSGLFGGRIPQLTATVTPEASGLAVTATGGFDDLDPGVILERPQLDGRFTGHLDVTGTMPRTATGIAPARVDLHGTVALGPSELEGERIDHGTITASVGAGRAQIERAEIVGDAVNLTASGTYGIDPDVPTSLAYAVHVGDAARFADVIGAPIAGDLTVDGSVTGQQVLHVDGTIAANGIGYRNVRAASLNGKYRAEVPRSDPSTATGHATLRTSDVAALGQTFEAIDAELAYDARRLTFDVDASQPERALASAGTVMWHPEDVEVQLTRFVLQIAGETWRLAEGATPSIRYGDEQLVVRDARLVAGANQSLTAAGAIGAAGSPLHITVSNIQLAPFSSLLAEPDLGGVLDGEAELHGNLRSPEITATVDARNGRLRGLSFLSVGGDIRYAPPKLAVDLRLVRPDQSWMTVNGAMPSAWLSSETARRDAPMDLHVRSSRMDLSILGQFTDRVADLAGTFEADVAVRGTLARPEPQGDVVIRGGAFRVPALGTRYTGLDTTVQLRPDAIVFSDARLYDEGGDWLSASGQLPVGEGAKGMSVEVTAHHFELVDNASAHLQIDARARVTGTLIRPEITGSVDVHDGRLNVDELFALRNQRAYATTAAQLAPTSTLMPVREAPSGTLADLPFTLDIAVRAPALLLAGRSLEGGGAIPVSLGNVNVTAAADLQVRKTHTGPLRVTGQVETVRGTYEFQNREFTLVRGGTVRFTGAPTIDPILDIAAEREISAVMTEVHVSGTLHEPHIELSSNPPLEDAEILSLIVFNQPTIQLDASERVSLARSAASVATGFLASEISGALGAALGIDAFEIKAGAVGDTFAPVVTVGQQFGDIYVRLEQSLGVGGRSQVSLDYEITDWLRIESTLADLAEPVRPVLRRIEGSGVDAVVSLEYGAPEGDEAPAPRATSSVRRSRLWRMIAPR